MLTDGAGRWLRGTAVGFGATILALGAHVLAEGGTPGAVPLAGLAVMAVLGAVAMSGQRWTLLPLLSVVALQSAVFHVAFDGLATGSMHHGHAASTAVLATHHGGWTMVVAHAVAALGTALLLRRGEDACWRMAELVTRSWRAVPVLAGLGPAPEAAPSPRFGRSDTSLRSLLLVDDAPRRGPPVSRRHLTDHPLPLLAYGACSAA
jgi:hypothetical protein